MSKTAAVFNIDDTPKTKKEIAARIVTLQQEITFWEGVQSNCTTCDAFTGRYCKRAEGAEPPPEVKATGCPEWQFDGIPF